MFEIYTDFSVNTLFFLYSDVEADGGQSNRLYEDIQLKASVAGFDFYSYEVNDKNDLTHKLAIIHKLCEKYDVKPIIHFNFHGDKNKGICLKSEEFMSWEELSINLKNINRTLENNLAVFFTTCHASKVFSEKTVEIDDITPFSYMVAPVGKTLFEEISSVMEPFYNKLLSNLCLEEACSHLNSNYFFYHSERIFAEIMVNYIKENCVGPSKKENIRRYVENVFTGPYERSEENKKIVKVEANKAFTPDQDYFKKYQKLFLAGKGCSFSIIDIWEEVRSST